MPTLEFKGKPLVYSHHLSVPFRELLADKKKSFPRSEKPTLNDNLIVHGDNLDALKALMPRYANGVDVIYIDPPYNTGSEGWAYNDNVNSPLMKTWLGKVVDRDDLERHDKWCCMMWPRLQLLKELLAPKGLLFVSIDENEIANLLLICDEILGRENRVETIIWKKSYGGGAKEKHYVTTHEYVVCYAKDKSLLDFLDRPISDDKIVRYYKLKDEYFAERGPYRLKPLEATKSMDERKELRYEIDAPDGKKIKPRRQWWWEETRFKRTLAAGGIEFIKAKDGWSVQYKQYLKVSDGRNRGEKPFSIINPPSVFSGPYTQEGTAELREFFNGESPVPYPKPTRLIRELLSIVKPIDSGRLLVLDSFAGSGSTAHAVLAMNKEDGGNRQFILIESEDYANSLTAERVRKVSRGLPAAADETLRKGLGGSFTYCELGAPIDLDHFFDGKSAPTYEQLARYVVYTATGRPLAASLDAPRKDWFVAESAGYRIHLIYRPDLEFMRSNDAALSIDVAKVIAKAAKGMPTLVYAAAKFMSQASLSAHNITFCQLPYAVHRILGEAPDAP